MFNVYDIMIQNIRDQYNANELFLFNQIVDAIREKPDKDTYEIDTELLFEKIQEVNTVREAQKIYLVNLCLQLIKATSYDIYLNIQNYECYQHKTLFVDFEIIETFEHIIIKISPTTHLRVIAICHHPEIHQT